MGRAFVALLYGPILRNPVLRPSVQEALVRKLHKPQVESLEEEV
jgi:hypothetical protein